MKSCIITKLRSFKWFALKAVIIAVLSIVGYEYVNDPIYQVWDTVQRAFETETTYAASTTPALTDKEERMTELKASPDAQRILNLWAEKQWVEEQETALEATREKLRGEGLDF
jgi:hypothetical protein